jgi:hypothetical protein
MALLPRELRPNWLIRISLVMATVFFTGIAVITTMQLFRTLSG